MYKYILAPLDGSKFSQGVLPYAKQIAKGLDIPIVLLHAIDLRGLQSEDVERGRDIVPTDYSEEFTHAIETTQPSQAKQLRYLDMVIEREKAIAQAYLTPISHDLEAQGIKGEKVVEIGSPYQEILRYAEGRRGGLIAMSTHGRSGIGRWALGSVADRVLYGAKSNLLLLRPDAEITMKEEFSDIVLPLDSSELAECALPVASYLAKKLDIPVHLVEAISISTEIWVGVEPLAYYPTSLFSDIEDAAVKYLDGIKGKLEEDGLQVDRRTLVGAAAARIVDYTCEIPDSLIVMATHGRSGLKKWVLGSVADKIVRSSGRPVLLIRPQEE
jgi:nucleotide-binding universal stress UspA family protein